MNRREFLTAAAAALSVAGVSGTAGAAPAKPMNILVITGSPRRNGNTAALADSFIRGAEEAGHRTVRFDAGLSDVHPCSACNSCGMDGPCVHDDDFAFVREHIISADLVALVTPVYYYNVSTQIKAVIDRFYAINGQLHVRKKAVFMAALANMSDARVAPLSAWYDAFLDYMGWQDCGRIIAPGVWTEGSIRNTRYIGDAYTLGRQLS